MSEVLQLVPPQPSPETATVGDMPRLLVEWSSPWPEFLTALRPALGRSPKRLAGEAPTGLFPYSGILMTWALEAAFLVVLIVLPGKLASLRPYKPPPKLSYDIIYFSGEELPRTEDAGGARAGRSGRAGGHETYHRSQTIRVARGESTTEKIVDVPKIGLPKSDLPVTNLLAINRVPGTPPAAGLKSSQRRMPDPQVVPPAPEVARDAMPAVPSFRAPIVAPPSEVVREKMRPLPALGSGIVAPPPQISRERMQSAEATNTAIVPPAPSVQREVAGARVSSDPINQVVPPPVSAPVNSNSVASRLSLPQASAVEPPPSQVTRENTSLSGGPPVGELQKQVVPPPVQMSGDGGGAQVSGRSAAGVVGGSSEVVAPPVQLGGPASGRAPGGTLINSNAAVPPPPTMGGGTSLTGRGRGGAGTGLGGPLDTGSVLAPPKGAGGTGGDKAGVVISSQPGSRFGVGADRSGSMAMSPAGSGKTGLGGSGGGSGIGRGPGTGSGLEGEGPGAAKTGTGHGSDSTARNGISPYPGPGGAGSGTNGPPAAQGINVRGGSNTITLPSFGTNGNPPDLPARSSVNATPQGPGITVIATASSGGAFNAYNKLKGENYTIYSIHTPLGPATLQFSDPTSATHSYSEKLTAPQILRGDVTDLPAGVGHPRIVLACIIDRSGELKNVQVLESGPAEVNSKVLRALPSWKFLPAERGGQPVEVTAILGFNIDTR